MLRHNLRFLRTLGKQRVGEGHDWVIATEASLMHLLAWRWWLARNPRSRLLLVFIQPPWLLYDCAPDGSPRFKKQAWLYRSAVRLFGGHIRSGRCRLAADATAVTRFLEHDERWPVADVVTPASLDGFVEQAQVTQGARLRIGVLGRPTIDRGSPRVLTALEAWFATPPGAARPQVEFIVQWQDVPGATDADRERLRSLEAAHPEAVRVLREPLSTQDYTALICSLHGGVLAYDRATYAQRCSNIAIQHVCAGVPFIATSGTWMSEELARHGAGELCDESPESLVSALERFAKSAEVHCAAALELRATARQFYSWRRFFELALPELAEP